MYQPWSPPMRHTASHVAWGSAGTTTVRTSVSSVPPVHSGSVAAACHTGEDGVIELRGDVTHRRPADGPVDRLGQRNPIEREERLGSMVVDHHRVDERVHQRPSELSRDRRDEADPQRRQAWGQDGHRDQSTLRESGLRGVHRHHLGVGDDVGPADLEHPRQRPRFLDDRHEVAQHVADRDRLAPRVHPLGASP